MKRKIKTLLTLMVLGWVTPLFAAQPPNETVITIGVKSPIVDIPDTVSAITFRLERPTDPAIMYEARFEWSLDDFATFQVCGAKDKGGIVTQANGTVVPWTTFTCSITPGTNRKARGIYSVTGSVHNTAIEIILK